MNKRAAKKPRPESTSKWVSHTGNAVQTSKTQNVLDASLDRIRHLFTLSDTYTASFSGGKDSTTVLMLSLQVARELKRLPLIVDFIDEEVLDPDTIAYATEVAGWPDIEMHWFCVPIRHTLRSRGRPHWFTWDPKEKDVWARALPPKAITHVEGMTADSSYRDVLKLFYKDKSRKFVCATGIRAEESFNRRRAIVVSGNYIVQDQNCIYAKPIYDWRVEDIWKAALKFKWPHSAYYDKVWLKNMSLKDQRIGPWGNVASTRTISMYQEFYPDFWALAVKRLPELSAAARYGNSKLYREVMNKPTVMTWQEYVTQLLDNMQDEKQKAWWWNQIKSDLKVWKQKATIPFPEVMPEGTCWKRFAYTIGKNDRLGRGSRDAQ